MSMITKIGLCFIMILLTATAGISASVRCPTAGSAGFVCCSEDKTILCIGNFKAVPSASQCSSGKNPCCYCPDDAKTTCNIDEYKKWDAGNCACVCVEEEPTDVNGNGICGGDLEWDSENCQCSCPDSATKEQECIKKAYATWDHTLCACECTQPSEPAPTGKVWSEEACDYVLSCDPDGSKQQACDQKNEGKELDDPIWALDEQCQMYCQGFCADYEELDEINCVCHPISTVFEESTVTDITPEVTVSPLESTTTTTPSLEGSLSITPEVTVSGSEEEVTGSDSITTTSPDVSGSPLSTTTAPEGSGSETTTAPEGSPSTTTTSLPEGSLSTTPSTTTTPDVSGSPLSTTTAPEGSGSETTTAPEGSPSTTTTSLPEGSLSTTPSTTTTPDVSGSPLSTTTAPEGSGSETTTAPESTSTMSASKLVSITTSVSHGVEGSMSTTTTLTPTVSDSDNSEISPKASEEPETTTAGILDGFLSLF